MQGTGTAFPEARDILTKRFIYEDLKIPFPIRIVSNSLADNHLWLVAG
jgi:hypothetical protein